jgi:CheY-like chemotaxis protein
MVGGFAVSLRFRLGRQSKSTRYKATTTVARKRRQSAVNKLGDKQILVVEDHPFVGEILTELLTLFDHPSHAASGKEALKQIKRKRPNIILLDLSLPDMNGLEVARLLRQNETTKSVRILAMSGNPMDKRNWLQAGCDDFILKPFSTSTLLARLSKLATRRGSIV